MERLLIGLLSFLARLILFAATGDWHKLDKVIAQAREALEELRSEGKASRSREPAQPPTARKRTRRTFQRAKKSARPSSTSAPWPFEFPSELTAEEPMEELVGGEAAIDRPRPVARSPRERRRPAPAVPSLAARLRRPEAQRDAVVLTALLGPNARRRR